MTFSTKHAMRYVVLAAALATLGGCAAGPGRWLHSGLRSALAV